MVLRHGTESMTKDKNKNTKVASASASASGPVLVCLGLIVLPCTYPR